MELSYCFLCILLVCGEMLFVLWLRPRAALRPLHLCGVHLQGRFPISYADAFAVALAQEMTATLITGDPEFKRVESRVTIMWL